MSTVKIASQVGRRTSQPIGPVPYVFPLVGLTYAPSPDLPETRPPFSTKPLSCPQLVRDSLGQAASGDPSSSETKTMLLLTSRLIVKHAEHWTPWPIVPPPCPASSPAEPLDTPRSSVVVWKKFCVVFSKACTEKFSQYVITLRVGHRCNLRPMNHSRLLGEDVVHMRLFCAQLRLRPSDQAAKFRVGIAHLARPAPDGCRGRRVGDQLLELLRGQRLTRRSGTRRRW